MNTRQAPHLAPGLQTEWHQLNRFLEQLRQKSEISINPPHTVSTSPAGQAITIAEEGFWALLGDEDPAQDGRYSWAKQVPTAGGGYEAADPAFTGDYADGNPAYSLTAETGLSGAIVWLRRGSASFPPDSVDGVTPDDEYVFTSTPAETPIYFVRLDGSAGALAGTSSQWVLFSGRTIGPPPADDASSGGSAVILGFNPGGSDRWDVPATYEPVYLATRYHGAPFGLDEADYYIIQLPVYAARAPQPMGGILSADDQNVSGIKLGDGWGVYDAIGDSGRLYIGTTNNANLAVVDTDSGNLGTFYCGGLLCSGDATFEASIYVQENITASGATSFVWAPIIKTMANEGNLASYTGAMYCRDLTCINIGATDITCGTITATLPGTASFTSLTVTTDADITADVTIGGTLGVTGVSTLGVVAATSVTASLNATNGVGGTFTTVDGKTVTVTAGIVTSIA